MKKYHTYFAWLMSILSVVISGLFICAFYLEPLNGGLTRMGGYSENKFGWQKPEQRFERPLYQVDNYNRYYDVVVFGDSFSYNNQKAETDAGTYWPNFLVNRTGLSLVSFHYGRSDLEKLIHSNEFKLFPPRLLIYEVVERDVIYVPNYGNEINLENNCVTDEIHMDLPLSYAPLGLQPRQFHRPEVYMANEVGVFGVDLKTAANFIKKNALRMFPGIYNSKVIKLNLTRSDLFSSQTSNQLLIYGQDIEKSAWGEKKLDITRCKLIALQNMVQSNGKTFFVLMIAPDKFTAYSDYLEDKQNTGLSKIDTIASSGLHALRLDLRIKKEVASGIIDLYLPNDTHWGSTGHKIAADTLVDYLQTAGVLQKQISSH